MITVAAKYITSWISYFSMALWYVSLLTINWWVLQSSMFQCIFFNVNTPQPLFKRYQLLVKVFSWKIQYKVYHPIFECNRPWQKLYTFANIPVATCATMLWPLWFYCPFLKPSTNNSSFTQNYSGMQRFIFNQVASQATGARLNLVGQSTAHF